MFMFLHVVETYLSSDLTMRVIYHDISANTY